MLLRLCSSGVFVGKWNQPLWSGVFVSEWNQPLWSGVFVGEWNQPLLHYRHRGIVDSCNTTTLPMEAKYPNLTILKNKARLFLFPHSLEHSCPHDTDAKGNHLHAGVPLQREPHPQVHASYPFHLEYSSRKAIANFLPRRSTSRHPVERIAAWNTPPTFVPFPSCVRETPSCRRSSRLFRMRPLGRS